MVWNIGGSRQTWYRGRYRSALEALLSRAPRTVLLCGSCGLELLINLRLDPSSLRRAVLFAFGPVARSLPSCQYVLVQGRRDWLSRLYHSRAHHQVDCGHLDYLEREEVLQLCEQLICRVVADLARQGE